MYINFFKFGHFIYKLMKFSTLILLLFFQPAFSQEINLTRKIDWQTNKKMVDHPTRDKKAPHLREYLYFQGANYPDVESLLPHYYELIDAWKYFPNAKIKIEDKKFEVVDTSKLTNIQYLDLIKDEINPVIHYYKSNKKQYIQLSFIPLRRNSQSHEIEKLISFTLKPEQLKSTSTSNLKSVNRLYAAHSVLKSGFWYEIKILKDGIYKITYSDLINMGFNNPENIRVYGNGGTMLSYMNADPRPDDLLENAIFMEKGSDGIFNEGDYILFYGKGPVKWSYDTLQEIFTHQINLYSDGAFYFLTTDLSPGKKITTIPEPAGSPNINSSTFNAYAYHEKEQRNLINSGRQWYGEELSLSTVYDTTINFPNLVTTSPVKVIVRAVSRSSGTRSFNIKEDNNLIGTISLPGVDLNNTLWTYAQVGSTTSQFTPSGDQFTLEVSYNKSSTDDKGWLDYVTLNARRKLQMAEDPLFFRDAESVGINNITLFNLETSNPAITVWDITDISNVKKVEGNFSGSLLQFKAKTDSLRNYVAFSSNANFQAPITDANVRGVGPVDNQDLHALGPHNLIIVSHPDFLKQADQLANFHRSHDGLSVIVVTPDEIYNEFSSGAPDVSAIRDFVKMIYDQSNGDSNSLKYLLLFGDGSYDNFSYKEGNANYILTYQSYESLNPTKSYVTDDFFGLLDDNEGGSTGMLDIGVGRFPVESDNGDQFDAQAMVNKVISYDSVSTMGNWRNYLCFVGDDGEFGDGSLHMEQSNWLATYIENNYPSFTVDKIMMDAYKQVTSSTHDAYPDVNKAILDNINKGMLIFNYNGHGGETGLALEQIVNKPEIQSWKNFGKLPLFVTATCEFSRFDDVEIDDKGEIKNKVSAGEMVLLNPDGGGIALFTTTRLVYAGLNFNLNKNFYKYIFERDANGQKYRLGDVIRLTKNDTQDENMLNFTLLGDPAITLAYPDKMIITDSVDHKSISQPLDTLKAFSEITVAGHVANLDSSLMTDFNGIITPSVFDKPVTVTTLGNDGITPYTFNVQKNVIYKGRATVKNGRFEFSFIVPKDISYKLGKGKISYYAENQKTDAKGYFNQITIGGTSENNQADNEGPELNLYMNDENFVSGGLTDKNPVLLALVSDKSGINRVGNGIGHDIVGILDNKYSNPLVLNDYYESEIDDFTSGKVVYQLNDLTEGKHTLAVKVWDIFNNSTEKTIEFNVSGSQNLVIDKVYNYPNPLSDYTTFQYEHNMPGTEQDITISIYDLSGRLVKNLKVHESASGYRSEPITWNATNDSGARVAQGIYVYRVKVSTASGQLAEKYGKLLILK